MMRVFSLFLLSGLAVACSSSGSGAPTNAEDAAADSTGDIAAEAETSWSTCAKADRHEGDECDLLTQDCADKTATCEYSAAVKHNACNARANGTRLRGETCLLATECDKGLLCYAGRCSPPCCLGDDSNCGAGGSCQFEISDSSKNVLYHVCSYFDFCHPFAFDCPSGQVCVYHGAPDTFVCARGVGPGGLLTLPGGACKYENDCGESQMCSGGICRALCWLKRPSDFTPKTPPDDRFPADGDCEVDGISYGTCKAAPDLGGGLGLCMR